MTRLLPLLELTKRRTRRLRRFELITTTPTTTETHSIIMVEIKIWGRLSNPEGQLEVS